MQKKLTNSCINSIKIYDDKINGCHIEARTHMLIVKVGYYPLMPLAFCISYGCLLSTVIHC